MAPSPMRTETDVLVIGAAGAGIYAAIEAARQGCRALLIDRSLIGAPHGAGGIFPCRPSCNRRRGRQTRGHIIPRSLVALP
jgi:tRNA U34 5-carboxymethylaminomethyl modifying enzyme MnmG/GidA